MNWKSKTQVDGNLTEIEMRALGFDYNLADAHTHQKQSASQRNIIERLAPLFFGAEKMKQPDIDKKFIQEYHALSGQNTILDRNHTDPGYKSLLSYSASMSMEIVANYLRMEGISVSLIEPTFDNIPDILKRHTLPLIPIQDDFLLSKDLSRFNHLSTQAIFLTLPNNPTGTYLSRERFDDLVRNLATKDKLIIIDTCFRLFEPGFVYDQYEILEKHNASYIVIEDTGKIWPTLDMKISLLNASKHIMPKLAKIHSDFLLNVSPFILHLLLEYFKDSKKDAFHSIRDLISRNRQYLRYKVANLNFFEVAYPNSNISVEFLYLCSNLPATHIEKVLSEYDIKILTGVKFFWANPQQGEKYVRIALSREPEIFREAVDKMSDRLSNC